MTGVLALMGAVMAWFGASILVLADARRGFAFGLLLVAAGLSLERLAEGGWQPALLLAAGGLTAALVGFRRTPRQGWGLLGPGSTPRVILCLVFGAGAVWLGTALLTIGSWQGRTAVAAVAALGAARLLTTDDQRAGLTAGAAVALACGLAAGLVNSPEAETAAALAGALAAVTLCAMPSLPEAAGAPSG